MQLSDSERRLVAHWKTKEQRWPTVRWRHLIASGVLSLFYTGAVLWFHSFVFQDITDDTGPVRAAILGSISPLLWGGLILGWGWFGFTLSKWQAGDVKTRLLLKLFADHDQTNG
ncbi:MAG: hypothetical protein IH623_24840 [Verrucomicrobia bacterium]|nr:hypothetical protein [Verrucomicrobiota bacterium]